MSDESANEPPRPQNQQQQNQFQQNQFQQQQQQFSALPDLPFQFATPLNGFFKEYRAPEGVYDENFDEAGNLRPYWTQLKTELDQIGADGMERRWKQMRRRLHQNGIAYSAYGDPTVRERHLQLDPLPHLVPDSQWSLIEAGLKQRADLLNLMLADLYGPRTLLLDGVLPHDILFDHPHYQLPYHDLPTPGDKHLHLYGAELIRSPQGGWWVMSDRTDSPAGSGFALENRIVVSRAFRGEMRRCNVRRLAPYFIALRDHLIGLAKNNKENPHIVVLSAGVGSSSYFEDSFLARYLGFTLVENNDLVIRSGNVLLKTLAGLVPIDVIVRRHQGNTLDPLELGGGDPGIPGILQVIRENNVVVVNAPGSGLVESPVFMAFMPRVCKAMLGVDLLLPGIATWWGGEARSLELILDRIDEIRLMPAFRQRTVVGWRRKAQGAGRPNLNTLRPESMTRDERVKLVRSNPGSWVGREKIERSSAAVWENGQLKSGYLSLKAFLTASGDSWHSLPGGLMRVSNAKFEPIRDPSGDGGAKDTWVLAEKSVEPTTLLPTSDNLLATSRSKGSLPSRVADNLCWLGRYLERADASARLLRSVISRMTDESDPADSIVLPVLIRALALDGQIAEGYAIKELAVKLPSLDCSLPAAALDRSDFNSLRSQVDRVVSLGARVRDRLSNDAWRILQEMGTIFNSSEPEDCDLSDLLDLADTLIVNLAAFSGMVNETMTRTDAFRFLNIGRRMENSLQASLLIKHCLLQKNLWSSKKVPGEVLEAILDIADSSLTYRSRYFANLQLHAVLDLLLIDEMNPRSLAYQIRMLNTNLEALPGNSGQSEVADDLRLAKDALAAIRDADAIALSQPDASGDRKTLQNLLDKIESHLPKISTSISNRFLVHSGPVSQLIADDVELPSDE